MSNHPRIVFLQRRPHPAGAQTCLLRLLKHPMMREFNPVLVSTKGWLTEQCDSHDIEHLEVEFPRSRSLSARLFSNRSFASATAQKLSRIGALPRIIHANDHLEGILGLELAKELQAKSVINLRSGGMERDDYFKYRCNEYDLTIAVSDRLQQKVQVWDSSRVVKIISDGVDASELLPPKSLIAEFPKKVLVIGSPAEGKGWADLTEALFRLEQEQLLPESAIHFTGTQPDPKKNDLHLGRHIKTQFKFLGRVEKFRDLVPAYDLVINASRQESFGMAAIEVLAMGVPLLSSRTGVIEQVQTNKDCLFAANDPADLARTLKHLIQNWSTFDFGIAECQKRILNCFNINGSVQALTTCYHDLLKS